MPCVYVCVRVSDCVCAVCRMLCLLCLLCVLCALCTLCVLCATCSHVCVRCVCCTALCAAACGLNVVWCVACRACMCACAYLMVLRGPQAAAQRGELLRPRRDLQHAGGSLRDCQRTISYHAPSSAEGASRDEGNSRGSNCRGSAAGGPSGSS